MKLRSIGLTLALVMLGASCGGDDDATAPDGGTVDVDAASSLPDAPAADAPGPSVLGTWTVDLLGGYFTHNFRYTIVGSDTGGTLTIDHIRRDTNGIYGSCTLTEQATGTWSLQAGILDVIPTAGRTRRQTTPFENLDCNETYAERDMTADELRGVDLADGPVAFEGEDLITSRSGSMFQWMLE